MLGTARIILKNLNSDFIAVHNVPLPEPVSLNKIIKILKEKSLKELQLPSEKDLDVLKKLVYQEYEKNGNLNSIPKKYLKELPFILPKLDSIAVRSLVIHKISMMETKRLLRREISVYFLNYGMGRFINELGNDIHRKLLNYTGSDKFFGLLKRNMYLFNTGCVNEAVSRCNNQGFFSYFRDLCFDSMLIASGFARRVLEALFDEDNIKSNLQSRLDLFVELYDSSQYRKIYQDILPKIIGQLIIQVEQDNSIDKENYKDILRRRALEFLGDPRIVKNNSNSEWLRAGRTAQTIFVRWISQYDLDLFFTIIDRSLYGNAKRMWKFRKAFWDAYRDHINMIWVCFGEYAKMDIRRNKAFGKDMFYGDFLPNDKSCLIIELGDYVFIERSHNGKLKVWPKGSCPFSIGEASIVESTLSSSVGMFIDGKDGWVHASPESYSWQKKVGAFISQYCRIKKTKEDWRPR